MRNDGNIEDILKRIVKKWETSDIKKQSHVREAWVYAAGDSAAVHSKPVGFKKGILTVIVENSSFLYKLTLEKKDLVPRFNESYKGRQKLIDIKYRVGNIDI